MNFKITVAIDIDTLDASPAKHIVTNAVKRVFRIEQLLQTLSHERKIVLCDKAFENAELNGRTIPFEEFMDLLPPPVVFDIIGDQYKLHHERTPSSERPRKPE